MTNEELVKLITGKEIDGELIDSFDSEMVEDEQ